MLLSLLTLTTIAILSFANALTLDSSAHHQHIARQLSVPGKRSSGRCRPRPTTTQPASTPTSTKANPVSSSPAQSPAPGKRGKACVAWPPGNDNAWLKNFASGKVSSYYTWSPDKVPTDSGLDFYAMLFGPAQEDDFKNKVQPNYAAGILGFNEPEQSGQSNIDPGFGIQIWNQFIRPLRNQGYKLYSPAITNSDLGKTWLHTFVNGCPDCVDVITTHYYGTNVDDFIGYMEGIHNAFGKPIAVTEYAAWNFNGDQQATQDQVNAFMGAVSSWMDKTPYVTMYCPFGFGDLNNVGTTASLMDGNGMPTNLAKIVLGI